jgi:hypothetical protein
VFLINRIPSPILNNKSPYFLIYNKQPDLLQLKVFGSLVYASTLQNLRTKLACRARKCAFLGYKPGMKGVVLVDINNREILISRNVVHHEHIFPYHTKNQSLPWSYYPSTQSTVIPSPASPDQVPSSSTNPQPSISNPLDTTTTTHDTDPHLSTDFNPIHTDHCDTNITDPTDTNIISLPDAKSSPTPTPTILPTPPLPRSQRPKHAPSYLKDFVCNSSTASHAPISSGTTHPISHFHSFLHLSPSHKAFSASLSHTTEPSPMMRHVSHMIGLMP